MTKNRMKYTKIIEAFLLVLLFTTAIMLSPLGIMQASADEITTTVAVGTSPLGVAVNSLNNKVYVTNYNNNTVTIIDGQTNNVITTLPVGSGPKGVAVDETDNLVYIANNNGSSLTVIDGDSDTVSDTVAVSAFPQGVAWNAFNNKIYVAHSYYTGLVTVIDASTGSVEGTVSVDTYPAAIAANGNSSVNKIYVAHENGTVTVIDGSSNTVASTLTVGSASEGVAVDETTNKVYVTNNDASTVSVIDGSNDTITQTVGVGSNPWGVAVNKITHKIYTANQSGRSVSVIDGNTNTLVQTIDIAGYGNPIALAVDHTINKIYVPAQNTNNLTVIDGSIIEAAGITGLTAPAAGASPESYTSLTPGDSRYTVSSLTWENLDGTSATLDGSGNFANAGNFYRARIELTAGADYKFSAAGLNPTVNAGLPEAGTVSGGDVLGNKLTFVVTFPVDITAASLSGMVPPAAGATPIGVSSLSPGNSSQYSLTSITWEDTGNTPIAAGAFPYGGAWIQARIVLTSQDGFKFQAGGLIPDVDGDGTAEAGTVTGGDVSGNTLTFVVYFSDELSDYQAYISGLNPPAAGATPQTAGDLDIYHNSSGQYYCTVSALTWKNSDGSPATLSGGKFISGGSTYRAVIELTSHTGYKFPQAGFAPTVDDEQTFVSGTVSGGYVSGNKFTYTVTFSNEITSAGITGLVAPVTGAVPVTYGALTVGNSTQYDLSSIEWVNSDGTAATLTGGKFNAGATYKAVISLYSNIGYKFPLSGLTPTVDAGTPAAGEAENYTTYNVFEFVVTFPATASDTGFQAVTNITDVPGTGTAGSQIDLTGATVSPADATNKTIVWTVNNAGTTGVTDAMLTTGKFVPANAGTLILTATINNGAASTTDYTKNFTISIASSSNPPSGGNGGGGGGTLKEPKIDMTVSGNTATVSIPKAALGTAGTDTFDISTPIASISFSTDALSTLSKANGDLKLTASKVDASSLAEDTKQLIGDRPVFNFSVTSGNNTISQFGGNVSVSVPYEPKAGEDTDAIVIYYINSLGKPEAVANCKYDPATKTVSFTTNHFSQYAVGYNKVEFGDVKVGAWYGNAVEFAAARGIVTGTGSGNFDPAGKLTRGQLLVMLMRAYGIEADTDFSNNFSDAGNTYYSGYLAAAKRMGITEGLGNNLYAPEKQITRQEMFTLLYNTLKVIGQMPEGTGKTSGTLTGYSDADSVASWAKDASGALANAGVIGGSNGKLSPKNTTTRAEMAQVLYNLLSK